MGNISCPLSLVRDEEITNLTLSIRRALKFRMNFYSCRF